MFPNLNPVCNVWIFYKVSFHYGQLNLDDALFLEVFSDDTVYIYIY